MLEGVETGETDAAHDADTIQVSIRASNTTYDEYSQASSREDTGNGNLLSQRHLQSSQPGPNQSALALAVERRCTYTGTKTVAKSVKIPSPAFAK